jgi:hypothetical protein
VKLMSRHLSEERLLDAAESVVDAADRAHLEECAECRALRDEVRAGLLLAREADVPEPSPLYWEAFRQQVGRRISEERTPSRAWLLPLAAAAAAAAFLVPLAGGVGQHGTRPGPVLPAWSALPPADEDDGLALLAGSGVAESDLAAVAESRDVEELLGDLSDEEQDAVAKLLHERTKPGAL